MLTNIANMLETRDKPLLPLAPQPWLLLLLLLLLLETRDPPLLLLLLLMML